MSEDANGLTKEQRTNKHKIRMMFVEEILPDLRKMAKVDFYRNLLTKWFFYILIIWLSFILVFQVTSSMNLTLLNFEPSKIEDIGKSILSPSITITGLLASFAPVVGFFFITDMKEKGKESKQLMQEDIDSLNEVDIDEKARGKDRGALLMASKLVETFWENLKIGTLNYIATFVGTAIFILTLILVLYILLNSTLFVMFDVLFLLTIVAGIIPIVQVALINPRLEPPPERIQLYRESTGKFIRKNVA